MRLEELQDRIHSTGTLRNGYAVVWNGTRDSASGTKYLDAEDQVRVAPQPPPLIAEVPQPLTVLVLDWIDTHGPATSQAIAAALNVDPKRVYTTVATLKTRKALRIIDYTSEERDHVRLVAIYGRAA